ncbi:MAG: hypothetical protein HYX53_16865 [Chloroflexi bacterium]|nr:hypothetical protein [Chloroflexota bacterium]
MNQPPQPPPPLLKQLHLPKPVSWLSLLRTVRAPLAVIVLTGIAVVLPSQSADMLAALGDGGLVPREVFVFYLSLAFLTFSGWYWARALISARFDVPYTAAGRARLEATDQRLDVFAFDAVPWLIYVLSGLVGVGLIVRSGVWTALWFLLAWVLVYAYAFFRPTPLKEGERKLLQRVRGDQLDYRAVGKVPQRSTTSFREWRRSIWTHVRLLTHRAPGGRLAAWAFIGFSLAVFVWGAVASFITFDPPIVSLPVFLSAVFTGPSAALVCLALMIPLLSLLTFVADGYKIEFTIKGRTTGPSRPPVLGVLVLWTVVTTYGLHLHTVRVVDGDLPKRENLTAYFKSWAEACAPKQGPVRPIIVAVSGGASRAAVWGAQVLQEVEDASVPGGPAVFAVSSVSGGSLGVAGYMALLAGMTDGERCAADSREARKKRMALLAEAPLGDDVLSALLAGGLAADIPRALLSPVAFVVRGFVGEQPRGGDRAEAIERAFERLWDKPWTREGKPSFSDRFLSLFYEGTTLRRGMPLWIANGTEVSTGSRLLTLPVDRSQWPFRSSRDVLALLDADVAISTAINNTARFPYLEPSGELVKRKSAQELAARSVPGRLWDQLRLFKRGSPEIIDGGYFENEGLQTALELAAWLEKEGKKALDGREVWPIIVQATADGSARLTLEEVVRWNSVAADPGKAPGVSPAFQFMAPISGLYNVRGGHSTVLLWAAQDLYKTNLVHFMLPGVEGRDVPLNWVLSSGTTAEIRKATSVVPQVLKNHEERARLGELLKVKP